jgi:hypothetical protein
MVITITIIVGLSIFGACKNSNQGIICTDKNFRNSYKNIVYNSEFVLGINDSSCLLVYEKNCGRLFGVLRGRVFQNRS